MNLPVMAAQSVAVERAGEAEKHFAASIHQTMTSIDNCADKRHYVKLTTCILHPMKHRPPFCWPPLLPSFSAAVQDFPPAIPAVQTRAAFGDGYVRGHSGDTLARRVTRCTRTLRAVPYLARSRNA